MKIIFLFFIITINISAQTLVEIPDTNLLNELNNQDTLFLNSSLEQVKQDCVPNFFIVYKKYKNRNLFETKLYCINDNTDYADFSENITYNINNKNFSHGRLLEEGYMSSLKPLVREGIFKIYDIYGNIIETKQYEQDTLKVVNWFWYCHNKHWNDKTIYYIYDTIVINKPKFIWGNDSLSSFIETNTIYPKELETEEIHGNVYVRFIIDRYGKVREPVVMRAFNEYTDEEAIRVVSTLPDWLPAKNICGDAVNVFFVVPVKF